MMTTDGCDEIVIITLGGNEVTSVAGTATGLDHENGTETVDGIVGTPTTFDDGMLTITVNGTLAGTFSAEMIATDEI
jgi:hypothetical protein